MFPIALRSCLWQRTSHWTFWVSWFVHWSKCIHTDRHTDISCVVFLVLKNHFLHIRRPRGGWMKPSGVVETSTVRNFAKVGRRGWQDGWHGDWMGSGGCHFVVVKQIGSLQFFRLKHLCSFHLQVLAGRFANQKLFSTLILTRKSFRFWDTAYFFEGKPKNHTNIQNLAEEIRENWARQQLLRPF